MRINLTTEHKKELADFFCVDLELLEKRLTIVVLRKWERGLVEGLYQLREYQEDFTRDLSAFEDTIDNAEGLGDRFWAFTGGWESLQRWYSPANWCYAWLSGFKSEIAKRHRQAMEVRADDKFETLWKLLSLYQKEIYDFYWLTTQPYQILAKALKAGILEAGQWKS